MQIVEFDVRVKAKEIIHSKRKCLLCGGGMTSYRCEDYCHQRVWCCTECGNDGMCSCEAEEKDAHPIGSDPETICSLCDTARNATYPPIYLDLQGLSAVQPMVAIKTKFKQKILICPSCFMALLRDEMLVTPENKRLGLPDIEKFAEKLFGTQSVSVRNTSNSGRVFNRRQS